jgi:hypothetical protein
VKHGEGKMVVLFRLQAKGQPPLMKMVKLLNFFRRGEDISHQKKKGEKFGEEKKFWE